MSNHGEFSRPDPIGNCDPRVPLQNLSTLSVRMDSVQTFLSDALNRNVVISAEQMNLVSSEISAAIHQITVNGAALLSCSQSRIYEGSTSLLTGKTSNPPDLKAPMNQSVPAKGKVFVFPELKVGDMDEDVKTETEDFNRDSEIVELDAMELLAEYVHFCEICGKGFKRDANLRMHMRAHGNQFKMPEALAKPLDKITDSRARSGITKFSCPFEGCNRSKTHKKFRPLKSVICLKNHFKRSHCPKMYSCDRCNKKSFSVLVDLKSHMKHCGESRWRCSCGTTFSRKDKLFGHMALFEGHMPAVGDEEEKVTSSSTAAATAEDVKEDEKLKSTSMNSNWSDDGLLEGLLDTFSSSNSYCLQDLLAFPNGVL